MSSAPVPPPVPPRPAALIAERRELLRFVLGTNELVGDQELDEINVRELLKCLREGRAFTTANGVAVQIGTSAAVAGAVKARRSTDSEASDSDAASSSEAPRTAEPLELAVAALPELSDELPVAAYALLVAGVRSGCDRAPLLSELLPFARAQLGVAPATAEHLAASLALLPVTPDLSLRLPLAVLPLTQGLRDRDAARWRRSHAMQILAALSYNKLVGPMARLRAPLLAGDAAALSIAASTLDAHAWAFSSCPLGCLLYATLLGAQWDVLDDADGAQSADGAALVGALRGLWPALGVSERAHRSHCVFACFSRFMSGGSVAALRTGAAEARALADEARSAGAPLEAREEVHLRATLLAVAARCASLLGDWHASFPAGAPKQLYARMRVVEPRARQRRHGRRLSPHAVAVRRHARRDHVVCAPSRGCGVPAATGTRCPACRIPSFPHPLWPEVGEPARALGNGGKTFGGRGYEV